MPFGNGKTSYKKAGFPDASVLTLLDMPDQSIRVEKLEAGRSREVCKIVNGSDCAFIGGRTAVVKMEVQSPPGMHDSAVKHYGITEKDGWYLRCFISCPLYVV